MHSRAFSSALGSAAFVLMCAATVPVYAQTDEARAGARSLATEGATAFSDGRFKDAVELFSKAESLVHAPPHLLFIARASTKLGQFVKAREAYEKAIALDAAYASPVLNLGILNDLYLQDRKRALALYDQYLALSGGDAAVTKWVADLKNRKDDHVALSMKERP